MNNVKVLLEDIEKARDNWDERSAFVLAGVKNLSISDLDSLELYANQYISNFGTGFHGLMEPMGDIAKVLEKYNLI